MNKNYLKLFITASIFLPMLALGLFNIFDPSEWAKFIVGLCVIGCMIVSGTAAFCPTDMNLTVDSETPLNFKRIESWVITLAFIAILPWKGTINVHNVAVSNYNNYTQKSLEKEGFYDQMWKTYREKKELTFLNEETFIKIAGTIMDARKDGEAVTWKWVQENSQIPFAQFSDFYKDLSAYIETQRRGYFEIEKECQRLANVNNTWLQVFPNRLYNVFLGKSYVNYEYGFTSDSTQKVFTTKREN